MTVRPSFPLLTFPNLLISLSLIIVAAQALNQPPPRDVLPFSRSASEPFQHFGHASTSYLVLTWAVIRRKYQKILRGQVDWVDMVQFFAVCSILQGIRSWRKRSLKQKKPPGPSEAGQSGCRAGGNTNAPSPIATGSSRQGGFDNACNGYRQVLMQHSP